MASHRTYKIRKRIYDELGYKSSAGVSHNKMLSKLGSAMNKPNKQTLILRDHIEDVMKETEIKKIR